MGRIAGGGGVSIVHWIEGILLLEEEWKQCLGHCVKRSHDMPQHSPVGLPPLKLWSGSTIADKVCIQFIHVVRESSVCAFSTRIHGTDRNFIHHGRRVEYHQASTLNIAL